jgi:hypothetical protein
MIEVEKYRSVEEIKELQISIYRCLGHSFGKWATRKNLVCFVNLFLVVFVVCLLYYEFNNYEIHNIK